MSILERKSTFAAKKESAYSVDPGSWAAADAIAVLEGLEVPSYAPDVQERNVIRNSMFNLPGVRGAEMDVGGNASLELHGSGTPGTAPESSILWESAVGAVSTVAGTGTTASGSTTTSIELGTGEGATFSVDDAIVIQDGTNGYTVTWVTGISTDTLTVSPACATAPAAGVTVSRAATLYQPTMNEQSSFYVKFWQGDTYRYDVPGCKVSQLTMDFTTGEIIKPQFTYSGKNTVAGVAQAAATGLGATPAYDDTDPLVAVLMAFELGGSTLAVSNAAFEVNNEHYKTTAVTTSGISKLSRVKGAISGSFSLEFENTDIETAFRADTPAVLKLAAVKSVSGNAVAVRIPEIRYTAAPKSIDSGIYKYDVTWAAAAPSGVDANAIFLSFL